LKHAFAFGFDTQIKLPHKSVMGWSWMAASAPVPVDDKAKGKDKKGAPEPVASGSLYDQGDPPPVLLSLDSAAFFTVNNENVEGKDETNVDPLEGENQIERPAYVARQSHLSISILVQADILEIDNSEIHEIDDSKIREIGNEKIIAELEVTQKVKIDAEQEKDISDIHRLVSICIPAFALDKTTIAP
jgi:hypothetical protein